MTVDTFVVPVWKWFSNLTDPLLNSDGIEVWFSRGQVVRPVKLWGGNPWTSKPWFVIRIPLFRIPIWPFLTWRKGNRGGYIGCKVAGYGKDWPWKKDNEKGHCLVPSFRFSRNLDKEK